ncbi:MAG: DUF2314 domain-containing protein [Myxococcaceae bacterium]
MKDVYILATEADVPLSAAVLKDAFASEGVQFIPHDVNRFTVKTEMVDIQVRFDARNEQMGWSPDLLTGSEEAHAILRKSRGYYFMAFAPGEPQPSVAVFETLWAARSLMEHVEGVLIDVTAYKLHEAADVEEITELEFDIRDHVNLHAVEAIEGDSPLWVHSHGMEKFGTRDVEAFHIAEDDLQAAETFFHELCTDLAFGQGPGIRAAVDTSAGESFMLIPSEEARNTLMGVPLDTFEGHEGLFLTIVSAEGRHTVSELLRPYRERFEEESPEQAEALQVQARELLSAFKARFHRRGLMEPLTFLVRAPFEAHPDGESIREDLWIEVLQWEEGDLVGKLVDGGSHTTEWRKGSTVELEEDQINAIALGREGKTLDEDDMKLLLLAEKSN